MVKQEILYFDEQTCKDATLSTMMEIIVNENGVKSFNCRECGRGYRHHTSLFRHFRNAHKEIYNEMVACRTKLREEQQMAKTFGLPYHRRKNEKRKNRSTNKKEKENTRPSIQIANNTSSTSNTFSQVQAATPYSLNGGFPSNIYVGQIPINNPQMQSQNSYENLSVSIPQEVIQYEISPRNEESDIEKMFYSILMHQNQASDPNLAPNPRQVEQDVVQYQISTRNEESDIEKMFHSSLIDQNQGSEPNPSPNPPQQEVASTSTHENNTDLFYSLIKENNSNNSAPSQETEPMPGLDDLLDEFLPPPFDSLRETQPNKDINQSEMGCTTQESNSFWNDGFDNTKSIFEDLPETACNLSDIFCENIMREPKQLSTNPVEPKKMDQNNILGEILQLVMNEDTEPLVPQML